MKLIAYYRVSTQKQGESGLGLEAQQSSVETYARSSKGKVIESYKEVESGKRADRPQLALAIAACKRLGATLVVAKLDRLARNVAFTSALMDSGIEFIACDNPNASRLTIHILAAVAEDEARRISERTKAALAAAKRRGVQLGNPALNPIKGSQANTEAADAFKATVQPVARKLRKAGRSLQEIAEILTGKGLLTRRGGRWTPTTVVRLLAS